MQDRITMDRKLELTDICMYLPYGLNFINQGGSDVDNSIYEMQGLSRYYGVEYCDDLGYGATCETIECCKPILRPMSDLTKPITHPAVNGGEEFVPTLYWSNREELGDEVVSNLMRIEGACINDTEEIELWRSTAYVNNIELQFLLKLHFDINDLIGQGLAIDINTLI